MITALSTMTHPLDDCEPFLRLNCIVVLEIIKRETRLLRVNKRMQREDRHWELRKQVVRRLMDLPIPKNEE